MPTIPRTKPPHQSVDDIMQELDAAVSDDAGKTATPDAGREPYRELIYEQFKHLGPDLSRDASRLMNACYAAIPDFDPATIKTIMTGIKSK
jgi:hypothetical protein